MSATKTTEIPAECNAPSGVHAWPADWHNGDTCNCGAFYMSTDGAAASIEETSVGRQIGDRATEARRYLYIQGFLTDAENELVTKRLATKR